MLLERLKEYADAGRIPSMAPPGYKETPVRYVIDITRHGHFLGVIDQAQGGKGREKRGKAFPAPHVGRSSGVSAKLLADNAEYALGIARPASKPDRVAQSHSAFVELVRECAAATSDALVAAVLAFLENGMAEATLPDDFDPSMVLTFRVDGELPIESARVKAFWAKRSGGGEGDSGSELAGSATTMQCLVCGQKRPAVERLPYKWQRIPNGQTAGLALISANAPAFESYGLEASLIAPTCADCGERFSKAANALLADRTTSLQVGPVAYVFWTREAYPEFSFVDFFDNPDAQKVRALLRAPGTGQREAAELEESPFYAAAFSASGARVVVRDWLDTTIGQAKENLRRYFELQDMTSQDGGDAPLKLSALAAATVREFKDIRSPTVKTLLSVALHGGVLPSKLLVEALQRCRAEGRVTRPQAALVKMVLLSNQRFWQQGGISMPTSDLTRLDASYREPAYLCGRLLAVLEGIQREALGDVNSTIVDRYYGTASTAPASVFARLLRGAQPHLSKLRRDRRKKAALIALEGRLMDILNEENGITSFPMVLDFPRQGLFALGYYHQRAADRAAMRERRAAKAGDDNPVGTEDTAGLTVP